MKDKRMLDRNPLISQVMDSLDAAMDGSDTFYISLPTDLWFNGYLSFCCRKIQSCYVSVGVM